jgi:protein-disulfide isomerase
MASRTKQKEEARAARLAAEQDRVERERRARRLRTLGAALAVAIVVVVVAVVVAASSGGGGVKKGRQANALVTEVQGLIGGIPQSGQRLGKPNAPVTMFYYGDLQCPVCADFTQSAGFSNLITNYVRPGRLQVVYRSVETATRDPQVFQTQQMAALAAGTQNLLWYYTELFYRQQQTENSGYVTNSFLTGLAQQVPGLNVSSWRADRNNPELVSQLSADQREAQLAAVRGTPTLVLKGSKGSVTMPEPVPSYQQLQQAIQSVS